MARPSGASEDVGTSPSSLLLVIIITRHVYHRYSSLSPLILIIIITNPHPHPHLHIMKSSLMIIITSYAWDNKPSHYPLLIKYLTHPDPVFLQHITIAISSSSDERSIRTQSATPPLTTHYQITYSSSFCFPPTHITITSLG